MLCTELTTFVLDKTQAGEIPVAVLKYSWETRLSKYQNNFKGI